MSFVNTSIFEDVGFGTALTKTYGFTPADGSSVLLLVLLGDTGSDVTSISGFTQANTTINLGGYRFSAWVRNGVTGSPTSSVINISPSTFAQVAAFNSDVDLTYVQQTTVNSGNSTTPAVTGISAASGNAVIAVFNSAFQRTWSTPTPAGFTVLDTTNSVFHGCVYDDNGGTGSSISPGATMSGSNAWDALAIEFSSGGGGGGGSAYSIAWIRA